MGWVRSDASWDSEKRHRHVGVFGRWALRAAVHMSKQRDWKRGERRGWVPRGEFDAEEIALHLVLVGDRALAKYMTQAQLLEELQLGLRACQDEGLLVPDGADGWWIDRWELYVPDPTARVRQQEARERKRQGSSRGVTGRHSDARNGRPRATRHPRDEAREESVTDGHGRHSDKAAHARAEVATLPHASDGHSDARDVTTRDVTLRPPEEEVLPPPPPEARPPDPPLPGVPMFRRPAADDAPAPRERVASPAASLSPAEVRRLEDELRGIEFDKTDSRRAFARFLRSPARQRRDAAWAGEVEELLRQPRREVAHA